MNMITATSWIMLPSRSIWLLLLVLAVVVCVPRGNHPLYAQTDIPALDTMSGGRVYMIAFPDTTLQVNTPTYRYGGGIIDQPDVFQLLIYSPVVNHVVITGPAGYHHEGDLLAGVFTRIDLNDSVNPAQRIVCTVSGQITEDVFRVEADHPVILYCHVKTEAGGDGWAVAPLEYWGKEYLVMAQQGAVLSETVGLPWWHDPIAYIHPRRGAPSELLVVAAYDRTRVTIDRLDVPAPENIKVIELNAGQCYQIQSFVDTTMLHGRQPELTGTRVVSDRPVAVLAGSSRANEWPVRMVKRFYESGKYDTFSDTTPRNIVQGYAVDWQMPTESMGSRFVVGYSLWDQRPVLRSLRLLSNDPTSVVIDIRGKAGQTLSLLPRQVVDVPVDRGDVVEVSSLKPIIASVQYSPSAGNEDRDQGAWGYYFSTIGLTMPAIDSSRWTTFAPFLAAPLNIPSVLRVRQNFDTVHYHLVVISDSATLLSLERENEQAMVFDTLIQGNAGLVCGQRTLIGGQSGYIRSTTGRSFYAMIVSRNIAEMRCSGNSALFASLTERIGQGYSYALGQRWRALPRVSSVPSNPVLLGENDEYLRIRSMDDAVMIDIDPEVQESTVDITIVNVRGDCVWKGTLSSMGRLGMSSYIDLSHVASGLYIIEVRGQRFLERAKFVHQ